MPEVAIHKVVNMSPQEVAQAVNRDDLITIAVNLGADPKTLKKLNLGQVRSYVFELSKEKGKKKEEK